MEKRSIRSTLTIRESDVLRLAVQGHTDRVIANKLRVKLPTVRTYWQRIRTKTGGLNRSQAMVAYVREVGSRDLDSGLVGFEDYFAAVSLHFPGVLCVTDLEGTIRFLSSTGHDAPPEPWLGVNLLDTVDGTGREAIERALEGVRTTGKAQRYAIEVQFQQRTVTYQTVAAPITKGSRIEGVLFLAIDRDWFDQQGTDFGVTTAKDLPASAPA